MLNQVFIEGISVPVVGMAIRDAATERVSTCSFSIPNPTPEILALCGQRATVHAYLTDGEGKTDYFGGRIKNNPAGSASTITTRLDITAYDYTDAANDVFVSEAYEETDGSLTDIVKNLWAKYYPLEIDLSGVEHSARTVPFIAFRYDKLFEATEQIAELLGWTWYVDWNGAQRTLKFFSPESAIKPVVFSRANCNVVAGSARFGQNEKICNRVYVFGGTALTDTFTQKFNADGKQTVFNLAHKPYPPEGFDTAQVAKNGTPLVVALDYPYWPDGKDCLVNFDGRFVRFNPDAPPAKDSEIAVSYRYEYPVAVILEDPASIARYGVIEDKIADSKIRDIRLAREVGKQKLLDEAFPEGYGAMEITEAGIRAGDFVGINMPHLGAFGTYEIIEIEKRVEGGVIRRTVTLNVADNPEARIAQRLKDFATRLSNLELGSAEETEAIQKITALRESTNLAETATIQGMIAQAYPDQMQRQDDEFTVLKQGTAPVIRRMELPVYPTDALTLYARLSKADTITLSDRMWGAFNALDKFDTGRFDTCRWGWEAS